MWKFKDCVQVLFVLSFGLCAAATYHPSFYWDPRNPVFQKNAEMNVQLTSKLNIMCPNFANVLQQEEDSIPWQQMFENLWMVDKTSYDTCSVDTSVSANRKVFDCSSPLSITFFPMVFAQFSAVENGLEFQRGHTYYFIATSNGTNASLASISGGRCLSSNMKLAIYVCSNSTDSKCNSIEDIVHCAPVSSATSTQTDHGASSTVAQVTSTISVLSTSSSAPALTSSSAVQTTVLESSAPASISSSAVQTTVSSSSAPASSSAVQTIVPSSSAPAPTSSSAVQCAAASIPDSFYSAVANQSDLLNTILNYTSMIPDLQVLLQNIAIANKSSETVNQTVHKDGEQAANCSKNGVPPVLGNCKELYDAGYTVSGVYRLKPRSNQIAFGAYCDQETAGGGWTVLLYRYDGSLGFLKPQSSYRIGFGDLTGEHWLGLNYFYYLDNTDVTLRFDLENLDGETRYAEYTGFALADSTDKYRITVPENSYSGNAGDAFSYHDQMQFTSKNSDNDNNANENCAKLAKGSWWFNNCEPHVCLTGYHPSGSYPSGDQGVGILWSTWNSSSLLSRVSMKLRPT